MAISKKKIPVCGIKLAAKNANIATAIAQIVLYSKGCKPNFLYTNHTLILLTKTIVRADAKAAPEIP